MPIRVVVDPNVWVSALISPAGAPAALLRASLAGEVAPVASPKLLDELSEVLARPKFRRWVSSEDARAYVEQLAARIDVRPDADPPSIHARDRDDDYLIALAESCDAQLVTGDADLLDLDLQPPALTTRDLLDMLAEQRQRP